MENQKVTSKLEVGIYGVAVGVSSELVRCHHSLYVEIIYLLLGRPSHLGMWYQDSRDVCRTPRT